MLNCIVLGTDATNRRRLEDLLLNVADSMDLSIHVTHVTDATEISKWQVQQTPALIINDHPVCAGRIPMDEEIAQILLTQPA